jgi:thiamine pyrophosphokinase
MTDDIGLLLLGGEGPSRDLLEPILPAITFSVAADSGFDLARRLNIVPDLLVGDFDSLEPSPELRDFPEQRMRRYPSDKDETDAELGLQALWDRGFQRVVVAGGGGGRMDHLLGLVALFERDKAPTLWYTSKEIIQIVEGNQIISDCRGQTVSFFPLGGDVSGMSSKGLKWPLDGLEWRRGDMGVSNLICEDRCEVSLKKGRLLMVRTVVAEEENAPENQA